MLTRPPRASLQVLGLIKDYAVQWRPNFLLTSMAYFDVLNIGVEMTAPNCGSQSVRAHRVLPACLLLVADAPTRARRWTSTRRTS